MTARRVPSWGRAVTSKKGEKTMEKNINELTFEELEQLFENNLDIRNKVWSDYLDMCGDLLEDSFLYAFRKNRGVDYSISYSGVRFSVNSPYYPEFLSDCMTIINSGFVVFSDDTAERIRRAIKKNWLYDSGDCSEENWARFSGWYENIVRAAIEDIRSYCIGEYEAADDLDTLTDWAFNYYENSNIVVNMEDWTAYETIVKRYA